VIQGQVSARREAVISVRVLAHDGRPADFEAIIDTGFSGFLTLPTDRIEELQLPFVETRTYALGDQRAVPFFLHLATIAWDTQERPLLVLATNGQPLVGMSLLHGHRLFMDVVDGGAVLIEPRPGNVV